MSKKIVIIGAGISGMVAGIYSRKMGFETEIYESHTIAGGYCTGWNRKGYYIDGCIEWLVGTKDGTSMNNIWKTCGGLTDNTHIYYPEILASVIHNGKTYHLDADLGRIEKEFLQLSPADHKMIKKLIKYSKQQQSSIIPAKKPFEEMGLTDILPMLWNGLIKGKPDKKSRDMTAGEFISKFESEIIRKLLLCIIPSQMPASILFYTLGLRTTDDGGWPEGGSFQFARRMRERFEELGGKIYLGKRVEEIVIKDGVATGIKLEKSGAEITADYVIPAIDSDALLHQLLKNKYKDEYFDSRYTNIEKYFVPKATYIALGIKGDLKDYPNLVYISSTTPLYINTTKISGFSVKIYNYETEVKKNGKTTMTILLHEEEFDFWKKLKHESPESYNEEKERIAQWVTDNIIKTFPELEGKIEMTDVATPLTFNRYCNSYKGAYMSFIPLTGPMGAGFHKGIIKGIGNMYVAGQWEFSNGGLPFAALAGKFAVQRICKQEKIKWIENVRI